MKDANASFTNSHTGPNYLRTPTCFQRTMRILGFSRKPGLFPCILEGSGLSSKPDLFLCILEGSGPSSQLGPFPCIMEGSGLSSMPGLFPCRLPTGHHAVLCCLVEYTIIAIWFSSGCNLIHHSHDCISFVQLIALISECVPYCFLKGFV